VDDIPPNLLARLCVRDEACVRAVKTLVKLVVKSPNLLARLCIRDKPA
jgi:hypothetical protein